MSWSAAEAKLARRISKKSRFGHNYYKWREQFSSFGLKNDLVDKIQGRSNISKFLVPSYRACDIHDNVLLQVQYIERHMNQWLLSGLYNAVAGLRLRPWLYKAAIDKRYHAAFHYDRLSLISDGYWTAAARLLDPWQYFLLPAGCLVLDERRRSYRVRFVLWASDIL